MDNLVAAGIVLAYRGVEFLDLETWAFRIGVTVDHSNNVGTITFTVLGIDVELDLLSGA